MNKRKMVATLMAVALLVTLVSANLALPAGAASTSLIAGKLPVAVTGSSCTTSVAGAGSLADVTDGVLVADGGSFLKYVDWGGACSANLTYDLGGYYAVSSFMFEHGYKTATAGDYYDEFRVYVSANSTGVFNTANEVYHYKEAEKGGADAAVTVTLTESVVGRYVGIIVYGDGGGDYGVRLGEFAVYGEEYTGEITEDDGSAKIVGGTVVAIDTIPEGNLIADKPSSLTEGWQDHRDGITHFTAQNIGRLTDGTLSDGSDSTQTKFIDSGGACRIRLYFSLDGFVTINKLLIDDGTKINEDFAIYVSKHPSTLYSESSRVFSYLGDESHTPSCKEISLTTPAIGKYVAFEINATADDFGASLAELGIYGSAQAGGATNLVAGQKPVDIYISEVGMPDKYNEGSATYGYLNETDVTDASIELFTDGNHETRGSYTHQAMDGRECSATLENRKKICADTPWSVLVYHLGGTATVDEIYLTSTSEGGYHWIGGADFYVGTTLATLFNAENRVYTSGGEKTTVDQYGATILDPEADLSDRYSSVVLDEARQARYVAIVVTRPTTTKSEGWSISRVNEIEVFGTLLSEDEKVNTLFTEDTYGCSLNLEQLNYDDVDFIKNIDRLEVKRTAYTGSKVAVDKWLMVDPHAAYTYSFILHTKDGKALGANDVGKRTVDVTIPNDTGHMQSLAKVQNGTPLRIVNARTENGQLVGEGITGSWDLTPIVFDNTPVIWSGIADGNGAAGEAAGATARTGDIANWLWLLLLLPVAAVVLVVAKHRRVQ